MGQAVYNTPTTQRMMAAITSAAFGVDMDSSHIHHANENPVKAIAAVISRVKHVHIRDCKGRQQGPGKPEDQANGRGDIDLVGYIRVLHEHGYRGPVNLEIIGAKEYSVEQCCVITAEARGHMQACLQACGAAVRSIGPTRWGIVTNNLPFLPQLLWLGGAPCAGKSSVAERLAAQYNLTDYCCDDAYERHVEQCNAVDHPTLFAVADRTWDEIWMRPVDIRVAHELVLYREEFGFILDAFWLVSGSTPPAPSWCPGSFWLRSIATSSTLRVLQPSFDRRPCQGIRGRPESKISSSAQRELHMRSHLPPAFASTATTFDHRSSCSALES